MLECVFVSEWICFCVCVCLCEWVCLWWWAMFIEREYVWLRNECVCVWVCKCVCLSMCVWVYVFVYVSECVCVFVYVSECVCVCLRKWVSVFVMMSHVDKAWICSAEEFLELYGKAEAVVRNCLLRWSGHLFGVPSIHLFDQCFCFKYISLFLCSDRSIFPLVPSFSLLHQRFYVQKWDNFEACISAKIQNFEKWKKVFLFRVLGMYQKTFKHFPCYTNLAISLHH